MPPEVMALVADFVKVHHVEEVFVKRKRKKAKNAEDESFSRRPPVERPRRAPPGATASEADLSWRHADPTDRKSTRLNPSHHCAPRQPSSALKKTNTKTAREKQISIITDMHN